MFLFRLLHQLLQTRSISISASSEKVVNRIDLMCEKISPENINWEWLQDVIDMQSLQKVIASDSCYDWVTRSTWVPESAHLCIGYNRFSLATSYQSSPRSLSCPRRSYTDKPSVCGPVEPGVTSVAPCIGWELVTRNYLLKRGWSAPLCFTMCVYCVQVSGYTGSTVCDPRTPVEDTNVCWYREGLKQVGAIDHWPWHSSPRKIIRDIKLIKVEELARQRTRLSLIMVCQAGVCC